MKNYPHSKSANTVNSVNLIKYLKFFNYILWQGIYCPLLQPFHRGPLSMVPDQALSYFLSATQVAQ